MLVQIDQMVKEIDQTVKDDGHSDNQGRRRTTLTVPFSFAEVS
jgi:hypothetical protein